jgi:hypothetical protein
VIEIQGALLTAVQVTVAEAAVTAMAPVDTPAATLVDEEPKANGAAAWLTASVTGAACPEPTNVIDPDLGAAAAFAATE